VSFTIPLYNFSPFYQAECSKGRFLLEKQASLNKNCPAMGFLIKDSCFAGRRNNFND